MLQASVPIDVLASRSAVHPVNRVDELLPWTWAEKQATAWTPRPSPDALMSDVKDSDKQHRPPR